MEEETRVFEDTAKYTAGTVISQFIGIFTSILLRKCLTPEMMGIWTTFIVILNYVLYADLGLFSAAAVQIPYLKGKNKGEQIARVRNDVFTFAVIVSLAIAVIFLVSSFIIQGRVSSYVLLGVRIMPFIIIATLMYNLYIVMLRADKSFFLLSKAIIFNSASTLIFIALIVYPFKLEGMYYATFLATLASLLYIMLSTRYGLRLSLKVKDILNLLKIGFPLIIAGVVYTVLLSVDKIMIIKMLGAKELGFYSIAVLALTYTHTFPKLFGIVMLPNMQEKLGKTESQQHVLEDIKRPVFFMAYAFPLLLAVAYFTIPVLVYYVLPKYIPGIASMKILLLGCFFISLVPLASNFIISLNKQIMLVPIIIISAACGIGFNYALIKMNYGINGVALGTSLSYMVYFAVMFFYSLNRFEKWPSITRFFIKIFIPLIYAASLLFVTEYYMQGVPLIKKTLIQGSIFYLLYLPLLFYIDKRTKMFSSVVYKIKDKIGKRQKVKTESHGV